VLKPYRYRLYPNECQRQLIEKTFGCCRFVYNLALEVKTSAYKSAGVSLSAFDLFYQLTDLKTVTPWLKEVDSQALQASVKRIDRAFDNFFRGNGFPKFKKKSGHQSFQCPNNTRRVDFEKGLLTIPKIKDIPIVLSCPFRGKIKTITISRTPTNKYFASILVDNKKPLPVKPAINRETTIGIDVGVKQFAVTSNGSFFEPNRYLKESLKRLQCLQRKASKKKKGSSNRKKANLRVAILHEQISNQRKDYIHKITSRLIRDNQTETFVIEDLHVKGMLKNRSLSQAISDVSFSEFFRQMEYKCDWYGKNLIRIGRFEASSKTCSACGEKNDTLTLADREWTCANCLTSHDRDLNAAKNIKEFGLKKAGEGISGEPVEP
jgi:putative transposase